MEANLLELVGTYGIAGAIAIYMVYWATNRLDRNIRELKGAVDKLREAIENLEKAIKESR